MTPDANPLARGFPRAPEPFGPTANRTGYAPRPATERALEALAASVRDGDPVTLFTGPPGIGKTLLLHVLGHRLDGELRVVFLPYAALGPEELCAVVLERLGAPRTEDSAGVLRAYARHLAGGGSALVLLVDDAGSVPGETLGWCCEVARSSGGAIRCVFALTDDAGSTAVGTAIGSEAARVRLDSPMTREETADYVQVQLAVGRASGAVRDLFDERVVAELHAASGGVPRRLHTAAQALLRRPPEARRAAPVPAAEAAGPEPSDAAAPGERAPGADTVIAQAIREEIDRLRQDAGRTPGAARAGSRRGRLMVGAFAIAVVVGLVVASVYRPLSTWVVPEPPEPEAPVRPAAAVRRPAATAAPPPPAAAPTAAAPAPAPAGARPAADALGADGVASVLEEGPEEPAAPPLASPAAAVDGAAPATAGVETRSPPPPPAPEASPELAPAPEPAPPVAAAPPVEVNINATPWARIEVDGALLGETPLAGVRLSAGPHRFRATLPDGRVIDREVVVDPDDPFLVFDEAPAP